MKTRCLSLYALMVLSTSCGGSPVDVEKIFGVSGQSYCDEVNIVFDRALEKHLTKSEDNAQELYHTTLLNVIRNSNYLSPDKMDELESKILRSENGPPLKDLRECKNIAKIHDFRSKNGSFQAVAPSIDPEGSGSSEIEDRVNPNAFREFLSIFGASLDAFSGYQPPAGGSLSTGYHYGLLYDLSPKAKYNLSVDRIQIFGSKISENEKMAGREILSILIPIGSKILPSQAGNFVSIHDLTTSSKYKDYGHQIIEGLLQTNSEKTLKVRVKPIEADNTQASFVEIDLVGIEHRQRRVPIVYTKSYHNGVYLIKILGFQSGLRDQLEEALEDLQADYEKLEVEGKLPFSLILDFRFNPGGSVNEAINSLDLFLSDGEIGSSLSRKGYEKLSIHERGETFNGPLAVLINHASASASEIFAQTLKSTKRAAIIGQRSFGKGIGQHTLDLGFSSRLGGSFRVTAMQFFDVNGESIQMKGVDPDLEVITDQERADQISYSSACLTKATCLRMENYTKVDGIANGIIGPDQAIIGLSSGKAPALRSISLDSSEKVDFESLQSTRRLSHFSDLDAAEAAVEYMKARAKSP